MRRKILLITFVMAGLAVSAGAQQPPPAPSGVKLVPEMPAPAPPPAFHFPGSVTKTLPNGLRVFVVPASAAGGERGAVEPAVSIELLIRNAGTARDPTDKPGVASLTAGLLTEGTEKRSAPEIAEAIDFVGGSLTATVVRDATMVRATVVKKDFDLAMDLLSDVALHAKFDPAEIERQREQLLSGLQVNYSDGGYLASAVFQRTVFGASPYGTPADGTPDTARAITRDDLVKFRDQFFTPREALLAFAGDVTPDAAFAAAEKFFGAWQAKAAPAPETAVPPRTPGLRIVVVDKPDAVQTQIRAGRPGIARNSPDLLPIQVTNQIFGGGYNSRLNTEVRLKKGLTYDASSDFTSYLRAGAFEASTFTRTEQTAEATRVVVDEIARMSTGEVTTEELNVAREYLAGVFTIATETPEQVADRLLGAALYGLPEDYNQTYPEKARGVTAEQVHQMAARYFNAADLDLVLVGKASGFRDALKQAFPTAKYEEIPANQLDLLAPRLRRAGAAAPGQPGAGDGPAIP
jgi:zinc protease